MKSSFRRSARALAWGLAFALPAQAAEITITLNTTGGLNGDQAYFASTSALSTTTPQPLDGSAFVDSGAGYRVFDMDDTTTTGGIVTFSVNLASQVTVPAGKTLILVVNSPRTSGTTKPMPLAMANGVLCSDPSSVCQDADGTSTFFYAARMANPGTTSVSFFPRTACIRSKDQINDFATGCTKLIAGATGPLNSSTDSGSMTLRFELYFADSTTTGIPASATAEANEEIDAHFYTAPPVLSCVPARGIYTPSDRAIFVDASKFSLAPGDAINGAPQAMALVAVKEAANDSVSSVAVNSSFRSANTFVQEIPAGLESLVGGFTNSTLDGRNYYDVGFLVRDVAGIVGTKTDSSCTLDGVETADIQGFLREGKCFIATAAFRNSRVEPVLLLRQFRDDVLLQFGWGRAFVRAYYAWSPAAAEWLIERPALRGPVLLALLPLQIVAWLVLQPALLALLALAGIALVACGASSRRRLYPAALLILAVTSLARAEETQPYIDKVKQGLNPADTTEGYTDAEKKRLGPSTRSQQSYTEWLRRNGSLTGTPTTPPAEGYTDREKQRLGAPAESGGAIAAVKEGRSELQLKREGAPKGTIGLRYGFGVTRGLTAAESLRTFDDVYGENYAPDISFYYEHQLLRSESWGSIGVFGQLGVSFFKGRGQFALPLEDAASGGQFDVNSARTTFRFFMVPAVAGGAVRINAANFVRPYLMAGFAGIYFAETRDDGGDSSTGIARAFYTAGGVAIMLDGLSRKATWSMYDEYGFKHFYLNIEYAKFTPLGGRVDFDVSGVFAGLSFDI